MKALMAGWLAIALTGCGSKSLTERTPGSAVLPATTGPVCILGQSAGILSEIPNQLVGLIKLRKGGDRPGDILDLFADEVRRAGGNVATVANLNAARGHGYGFFVDPKLKFSCIAAGGQQR